MGERQAISSEHQPAVIWPSTAERIRDLGPGHTPQFSPCPTVKFWSPSW